VATSSRRAGISARIANRRAIYAAMSSPGSAGRPSGLPTIGSNRELSSAADTGSPACAGDDTSEKVRHRCNVQGAQSVVPAENHSARSAMRNHDVSHDCLRTAAVALLIAGGIGLAAAQKAPAEDNPSPSAQNTQQRD